MPRTPTLACPAAIACFLALMLTPMTARADRPSLNGHTFISTDLVPDAQVRTYIRNNIGYTMTPEFDYPPVAIRGDTLAVLSGSLAYALLGMEYQSAIRDWIGVRASIGMRTRLGTQAASLVNEGVNVSSTFELGWLVRLRETQKTALSVSLDVTRQTLTLIDLRQFTEDVVDGNPEPRLIDNVPMIRTKAGLRFGWAVSRPLGVTLLGEGSYGEAPHRGQSDSWEYGLGASVDFDGHAAWGVPVGFAVAYRETSLPVIIEADHGKARQTLLRIAYTGKPDFLVALDIMGLVDRDNVQVEPVWSGGAAFSLRYYF
ncbi:MAG TPA: hypothetical protein VFX78_01880 [Candidatus Eisenbacteria bacterium]|nr:hypothetical protein [Candidatus Eisenbacteria bacterium]